MDVEGRVMQEQLPRTRGKINKNISPVIPVLPVVFYLFNLYYFLLFS